ncbi:MAG: N-acetylglucosamine-6-phosphate deacetylase [Johnsonella sp.]|nr:N-acetylglucosamine-6-phosphate deacetylase [Johnsonella sp.]
MGERGLFLRNAKVYNEGKFEEKTIEIKNGIIHLTEERKCPEGEQIDLKGKKLIPGFIDIHTHGAAGIDVNAADEEGLAKIAEFFAKNGSTSFLISVLTDSRESTRRCIETYRSFKKKNFPGAELLGIHLEGPFLAKEYKGAMPERFLKKGDLSLLKEYQSLAEGEIRYITISPEVEGVLEMIPDILALGIIPSIGHSGATYESCMEAIAKGVKASTHTFNAMGLLHQHYPGVMGAVLESDVYCEAIFDGKHLHPGTVRLLLKTKGPERVIAITDSIMAAGLPDGRYKLGVNDVVVEDSDAKLADTGVRAGSTLTMPRALENIMRFTGLALEEVIPLFSENPAKLLGIFDRKGSIAEGKDADLIVLNEENRMERVFVKGKIRECEA